MTLKKALVAITVVAMLFGMVGTAFAATSFPDVTDSKTAAAATRLNALKIVTGYPDGNFGVGDTVTRAQFAAIAVRALGLDSAATYAKGATKFSDVSADYWASGYINIATQQGIIAGYPDGKFGPEDKVTYAQALTIIVRMLGYSPVVEGKGTWPANYIAKASQLGFTKGVAFNGTDSATRGNIALFVDGALTVDLMMETGVSNDKPVYNVQPGHTLLTDYLKATPVVGYVVGSNDAFNSKLVIQTDLSDGTTSTAYDTAAGVSLTGILGAKVKAWVSSDDEVFFAENLSAASAIVDTADGASTAYNPVGPVNGSITLADAGSTYIVGENTKVFVNGATATTVPDGAEVSIVADGKTALTINAYDYTLDTIASVDASGKKIYTNNNGTVDVSGTDYPSTILLNGKVASIADLKADDVIQYYDGPDSASVFAIVTRNAKSGVVSKVIDATTDKIVVDSVSYPLNTVTLAAAQAYIGKTATVLLDKDGGVVGIKGATSTETVNYAVVTKDIYELPASTGSGVAYYVGIKKADGTSALMRLADNATFTDNAVTPVTTTIDPASETLVTTYGITLGKDLVSYTVNANGEIKSVTLLTGTSGQITVDSTLNRINTKVTNASTIVFDVSGATPEVVAVSDLVNSNVAGTDLTGTGTGATGYVITPSSAPALAKVVVIDAKGGAVVLGDSAKNFYVASKFIDADGLKVTVFGGGVSADYLLDASLDGTVSGGKVINGTVSGGKIQAGATVLTQYGFSGPADSTHFITDHAVVRSIDTANNLVEIALYDANGVQTKLDGTAGTTTYFIVVTSDTQFIDVSGDAPAASALASAKVGQTVKVYATGDVADVIIMK